MREQEDIALVHHTPCLKKRANFETV